MYGFKNCVNNQLWIEVDFDTERARRILLGDGKAVHLGALPYVICISNTIKHVLVHVLKLPGTQ